MTRTDVLEAVCRAEAGESQLTESILSMDGMSSPRVRHLLNNLGSKLGDRPYVEVGALSGATLISAAHNNPGRFIGIDNFSQFNGSEVVARKNIARQGSSAELMACDFLTLHHRYFEEIQPGIVFYDGDHGEGALRFAMDIILPSMTAGTVLILDDYNHDPAWSDTRRVFWDWIGHLQIRLDLFLQLPARFNGDRDLYWNGLAVALF